MPSTEGPSSRYPSDTHAYEISSRAHIRVRETQLAEYRDLAPLHATRISRSLVVVADEMQCPVDHEVRPVRAQTLLLLSRFALQNLRADHEIAQCLRLLAGHRARRQRRSGKRQHVRRVVLAAIVRIQTTAFGTADDAYAQLAIAGPAPECGVRPRRDVRSSGGPRSHTLLHVD